MAPHPHKYRPSTDKEQLAEETKYRKAAVDSWRRSIEKMNHQVAALLRQNTMAVLDSGNLTALEVIEQQVILELLDRKEERRRDLEHRRETADERKAAKLREKREEAKKRKMTELAGKKEIMIKKQGQEEANEWFNAQLEKLKQQEEAESSEEEPPRLRKERETRPAAGHSWQKAVILGKTPADDVPEELSSGTESSQERGRRSSRYELRSRTRTRHRSVPKPRREFQRSRSPSLDSEQERQVFEEMFGPREKTPPPEKPQPPSGSQRRRIRWTTSPETSPERRRPPRKSTPSEKRSKSPRYVTHYVSLMSFQY